MRTYSEFIHLATIDDCFDYLVLGGGVGDSSFGYSRFVNQSFYHSREWRNARSEVIVRDEGCEMGLIDYPIRGAPQIHHMNPLTMEDFETGSDNLMNPEFLITVSHKIHNAIHFGDRSSLPRLPIARVAGDTRLW